MLWPFRRRRPRPTPAPECPAPAPPQAAKRPAPARQRPAAERVVPRFLNGFRGDPAWIHREEGHRGHPYTIPGSVGSRSGVTLDPGVDLGHVDPALFEAVYFPVLRPSDPQRYVLRQCYGKRGAAARRVARTYRTHLGSITVSREQAARMFPMVADPYWEASCRRFPGLREAPGPVQTAVLSIAYNRGAGNRRTAGMGAPIRAGDWGRLADVIDAMQRHHSARALKERRHREAELVRTVR